MANYFARRRRYRSKTRRGYKKNQRRLKSGTPRFKKQVKSIIQSMVETKQAYHTTGDTYVKFNSGIDSNGDILQIVPSISQGTADNARVGDQLRAQSLNIKGIIRIDYNNAVSQTALPAVAVRLMVLSFKNRLNYPDAATQSSWLGSLLKKGGTTTGFTGVLRDLYSPINTDVFTCHYNKVMYLTQDALVSPNGTANPGLSVVPIDFRKCVKFFNINVKCKNKLLKYDAYTSPIQPINWSPFMCLGYAYLDGSSPDVINTKTGLQYDTIFNYEDA